MARKEITMNLLELREEINAIDAKVMSLLESRFALMQAVKIAKAQENLSIDDAAREAQVLAKALPFTYAKEIQSVYALIIRLSKALQQ
jgi:chorismate mutase